MINLPAGLTFLDVASVALHLAAWGLVSHAIEHPRPDKPSVSAAMRVYRRGWMEQFLARDTRIFDGNILSILQHSTSFFASACMIAIGGGLALIGNADMVASMAQDVDVGPASPQALRIKIVLALILVINAFLKFVWALRLFGYCAILMASVPNDPAAPGARGLAMKAAEVNINAARNFNAGMRAIYFAISALAWLIGPWALTLATIVVTWSAWRREFASGSRRAILADDAAPPTN
ncbi:DUF599 domain-containing protein [Paracoccus suum]|uniref:DUF599 domain-containing protein n=1 Tax=Paracoccus suum TaxID=2259340 RepID=A0A344PNG0_9RHOB|nr:DUF599 domain-containing protein [Paracoccus suum]AXC50915.1 DUF599 domain-containing protein [Paracoccus suum]